MVVYKKHLCENCGFTWIPKAKKPVSCPNCDSKNIAPSTFQSDLGIESLD